MSLQLLDASSWNPNLDWEALAKSYSGAIIKATGGTVYRNPLYRSQIAGARQQGLLVGHYHYAHETSLDETDHSALDEAHFFFEHADIRPGELVALDIEDPNVTGNLATWAEAWLDTVAKATGANPFLYTYEDYYETRGLYDARLARFPLWYARYWTPETATPWPRIPRGRQRINIWQWSGGIVVPGSGGNKLDQNVTQHSLAELRLFGVPQPPAPETPTEGEHVKSYIAADGSPVLVINFGGKAQRIIGENYQDVGVSYIGEDGSIYDHTLRNGVFEPRRKRE